MGSFNETCALSNLNIPVGCPIRLLFLTQNPYVECDQHEAHRGVYHYDNWFLRTPPLKGRYADYGEAKLDKSPLVKLVANVFSEDVIERPFGFNQFHALPVLRGKSLDHYLAAAWEGRLLVRDNYTKPTAVPEDWPTWDRVMTFLKKAKLPIQTSEEKEGYNAQDLIPGVVCVHFNAYGDTATQLAKAEKVLSAYFDCKSVKKFQDREDDKCLLVVPQGAFGDPTRLAEIEKIKAVLETHPEMNRSKYSQLPVLAVMVREDVWHTFVNIEMSHGRDLQSLLSDLTDSISFKTGTKHLFLNLIHPIPFQTSLDTHISYAVKHDLPVMDELLQACAEAMRVEFVMSRLHRPWFIPPLGGQDGEWKLHTELLAQFHAISKKELEHEDLSEL